MSHIRQANETNKKKKKSGSDVIELKSEHYQNEIFCNHLQIMYKHIIKNMKGFRDSDSSIE